jgi:uncharacterized protein YcsI (UPF0317 family)
MAKKYSPEELGAMTPKDFRSIVRKGEWTEVTADACRNYGQANLIALPREYAFEFLLFCNRNPRPCYVLDVTELGNPEPKLMAPDADIRTDLPRYRVFKNGKIIDEPTDATNYWRDDLVAFLIGCSWGFVWAFKAANVPFRSLGDYTTNIPLVPVGRFHGHMVCSCRAFQTSYDALRAIQISSRHIAFHGPPVHIGEPTLIGVNNIGKPDAFIPPWPTPPLEPHEIAMFWGCGITPQNVVLESKIPYAVTHYPGHMFVIDKLVEELAIF